MWAALAALVCGLLCPIAAAARTPFEAPNGHLDASRACVSVFGAAPADSVEADRIVAWLVEEVNSRLPSLPRGGQLGWAADCGGGDGSPLALAVAVQLEVRAAMPSGSFAFRVHGNSAAAADDDDAVGVQLAAADLTGLRAGAGRLLRELHMPPRAGAPGAAAAAATSPISSTTAAAAAAAAAVEDGNDVAARFAAPPAPPAPSSFGVSVPESLAVEYDPARDARWAMRGHQIATNSHPFQFRTLPEFAQFARDLVVFGTTLVEMGHVPLPLDVDALAAFADASAAAGMNLSVWGGSDSWSQNYTASAEARWLRCCCCCCCCY